VLECPRRRNIFPAHQGPGSFDGSPWEVGAGNGQQRGGNAATARPGRNEDVMNVAAGGARANLTIQLGDENRTARAPQNGRRLTIEIGT